MAGLVLPERMGDFPARGFVPLRDELQRTLIGDVFYLNFLQGLNAAHGSG